MQSKLNVAFLWHHHQPYYKNPKGYLQMPWVRFHGIKDYVDMLLVLKEFPDIKQTINLVPSLLLQIEDYIERGVKDNVWLLTEKPASELNPQEKQAILENFFMANYENMIRPYPGYLKLHNKCNKELSHLSVAEKINFMDETDFTDLQVWYNLAWMGILSREHSQVKDLFAKGGNFIEEDKQIVLNEHLKVLSDIFPMHQEMWDAGQIEISTSPFYHPILPLLVKSSIGKESSPHINLPQQEFKHPEDAEIQIKKGLEYFERVFGRRPAGIWPSEGSVSEEVAELLAGLSVKWIATDEEILAKSLGKDYHNTSLYQPFKFKRGSREITIFFRDHYLSDAIGFVYGSWEEDKAVDDFISRLLSIRKRVINRAGEQQLNNYVVSVILDGENCWEYYKNDGRSFLRKLYARLSEEPLIRTVLYDQFLNETEKIPELPRLHPGSWINGNFNIWIGSEEDNRAWDLLKKTRDYLVEKEKDGSYLPELMTEAWEQIYIAEGSDWCWWYGDEHSSSQDLEFDLLFRQHLMRVYEIFGEEVPIELYQTIKHKHFSRFEIIHPLNLIQPTIDGRSSHFFEWNGAAIYDGKKLHQAAMHQVSRLIDKLFLGFDLEKLYLRIDFINKPDPLYNYVLSIKIPHPMTIVISPLKGIIEKYETENENYKRMVLPPSLALDVVLEAAVSFEDLKLKAGNKTGFQIHIKNKNQTIERFPSMNIIEFEVPDKDYNLREWSV
jgi:alpha-amylase/alpha-mannosidase (GH57 family)